MIKSQKGASNKKVFVTSNGSYISVTPEDLLGKGTYGVVYRARNEKNPGDVKAIKTFTPETMDENEGIPPTTLREINALKVLQHPNVLKAEDIVLPQGKQALTDMFVVMELCKGTLKDKVCDMIQRHLKSDPKYCSIPPNKSPCGVRLPAPYVHEAKLQCYQLLNALAYIHSRGIIHRDLKPVNIMWGYDDLLKFGDFGLARFMRGNQNSKDNILPITGEVQTMWYRAPEVLLGDEQYGAQVDDWSLGCIIAELFRFRKSGSTNRVEPEPLFNGRSDPETLMMIFETIGRPRVDADPGKEYLGKLPYWSSDYPKWDAPSIRKRVPLIDEDGLDLVCQLLMISPCERCVAKHLLDHRWFDDIRAEAGKAFRPWYAGLERGYEIMAAVDRMAPAQKLSDVNARIEVDRRKEEEKAQPLNGDTRDTSISNQVSNASMVVGSNYVHQPSCSSNQQRSDNKQTATQNATKPFIFKSNTSIQRTVGANNSSVTVNSQDEHQSTDTEQKKRNQQQRINDGRSAASSSIFPPSCGDKVRAMMGESNASYLLSTKNQTTNKNRQDSNIPQNSSIDTAASKSYNQSVSSQTNNILEMIQGTLKSSQPVNKKSNLTSTVETASFVSVELQPKAKRAKAVTRRKRSSGSTTTRSRRIGAGQLPKLPLSSLESTSTNKLLTSNATSSVPWASRSRSPDRAAGGTRRNISQRRTDRLPANQTQLPITKMPLKTYLRQPQPTQNCGKEDVDTTTQQEVTRKSRRLVSGIKHDITRKQIDDPLANLCNK